MSVNSMILFQMPAVEELVMIGFVIVVSVIAILLLRRNYLLQIKVALYMDVESMVYNRIGLAKFMKKKKKRFTNGAIVVLQMDNYRQLKEMYNNPVVLADQIVKVLLSQIEKKDCIGRLTSNVFVLALTNNDKAYLDKLVDSIEAELLTREFGDYGKYEFRNRYAINNTVTKTTDFLQAIDYTYLQLRYGKPTRGNIYYYDEFAISFEKKLKAMDALKKEALENNQFVGYIQPKVSLETGKVVGGEMLCRWVNANQEVIYTPDEFVPLFEQNGFIRNIDLAMLEQICQTQQTWKRKGIEVIPLSFNISKVVFTNAEFIKDLKEVLSKYSVDPTKIEIEVTESIFLENYELVTSSIMRIKELGFSIAMDDFGKEYSSLTNLLHTPFETIKLDALFVVNNLTIKREQIIVEHMINMIKEIGLKVVIEGVETDAALKALCEINNTVIVQGFCFSKPVTLAKFELFMHDAFKVYPGKVKEEVVEKSTEEKSKEEVLRNAEYERQLEAMREQIRKLTEEKKEPQPVAVVQNGPSSSYVNDELSFLHAEIRKLRTMQATPQPTPQQTIIKEKESDSKEAEIERLRKEIEGIKSDYNETKKAAYEEELRRKYMQQQPKEEPKSSGPSLDELLNELKELKNISKSSKDTMETFLNKTHETKTTTEATPGGTSYHPTYGEVIDLDLTTLPMDDGDDNLDSDEEEKPEFSMNQINSIVDQFKAKYDKDWDKKAKEELKDEYDKIMSSLDYYREANKPFIQRIHDTTSTNKKAYNIVKNEIMKYTNITNTLSKAFDTFKVGKETIIKITLTRKCLKIYFALDPKDYPTGKFAHVDVSDKAAHGKTPLMLRLRSALSVKRAMILIADLMTMKKIEINKKYTAVDYLNRSENNQTV